jgi:exonuclease VII small subunit
MKALKEAQTELETIEPEVDRLLGELEEEWAKGMVSKDRYKIMRNNILRDLFRLRAKCARIEQQKHLFWVNEASLLIATSSVPESFTQELLRRLEKTTLDLNQARKGIL